MRSLLPVPIAAVAALAGCRIATEYVPQSAGRASIGVERGELGVYKNGVFAPLNSPVTTMLSCSAPASSTAGNAVAHHARYRHNTMISATFYALSSLVPLFVPIGAMYGVRAAHEQQVSFALAVDAVNMHNDASTCAAAPAPPVAAGARP